MIEPGKRYYIATPYTKYPSKEAAWKDACRVAATLKKTFPDSFFYSPIAETYGIETFGGLELTHDQWMAADKVHVDAADALIFAHLPTAKESKGMKMEVDWFTEAGKPVMDLYLIYNILERLPIKAKSQDQYKTFVNAFYYESGIELNMCHPDIGKEYAEFQKAKQKVAHD